MNLYQRLHFLHRAWRYRFRAERCAVGFLMSRQLRGATVIDIGAHRGIYSYWMHRKVGRAGRVIAFEPQPELHAGLHQLKQAFGMKQLEVVQAGVSSKCGELTLVRPKNFWAGSSFENQEIDPQRFEYFRVPTVTLDEHLAAYPSRPVRFIKCDVETHELQVFRGAKSILDEDRPDLLFECFAAQDTDNPTFRLLRSRNYVGFCFTMEGLRPVEDYPHLRESLPFYAQSDFVFLPAERVAQEWRLMAPLKVSDQSFPATA